jgi:hypothetical protein
MRFDRDDMGVEGANAIAQPLAAIAVGSNVMPGSRRISIRARFTGSGQQERVKAMVELPGLCVEVGRGPACAGQRVE